MIVNRKELADVFGCALTTIDRYVQDGMPFIEKADASRAAQWRFDTKECIQWLVKRESGEKETVESLLKREQVRERTAVASLREYELASVQREMVNVADIAEKVETQYAIIKSRIMAIPGRMATPLSVETDAAVITRMLRDEVIEALEEISGDWSAHTNEG